MIKAQGIHHIAIMTGEIFLRMIPLLAQQGIRTLGEAREASHHMSGVLLELKQEPRS